MDWEHFGCIWSYLSFIYKYKYKYKHKFEFYTRVICWTDDFLFSAEHAKHTKLAATVEGQ